MGLQAFRLKLLWVQNFYLSWRMTTRRKFKIFGVLKFPWATYARVGLTRVLWRFVTVQTGENHYLVVTWIEYQVLMTEGWTWKKPSILLMNSHTGQIWDLTKNDPKFESWHKSRFFFHFFLLFNWSFWAMIWLNWTNLWFLIKYFKKGVGGTKIA